MKSPEARDYYPTGRRGMNRRSTDHHVRNVMLLVLYTVIVTALTCLFAYFFDQLVGIDKAHTLIIASIYLQSQMVYRVLEVESTIKRPERGLIYNLYFSSGPNTN